MAKVIFLGSDRRIFESGGAVEARMISYGELFEELHIIVSTKRGQFQSKQIAKNTFVHSSNSSSKYLSPLDHINIARAIIGKDPEADWIVSAQDPFELGFAASRVCEKSGAKLHIQIHVDMLSPFFNSSFLNKVRLLLARRVLLKANGIRVVSKRIKQSLLSDKRYRLNVEPQILPIYQEPLKDGLKLDFREAHPKWSKVILMVGRLEPEKNYLLALRAFKKLLEKYPATGLAIVGGGSQKNLIESEIKKFGISDSVAILGDKMDAGPYYRAADVFMHTANYEGFGLVLVEAGQAGLPIVTTNVGAADWIFRDGESALVVPVGDATGLANSLISLFDEPKLKERLISGAHSSISRELPKDKSEYLNMYKMAILKCLETRPLEG
jgi:glycosyltransferase involved in cell wall biosynthesis